MTHERFKSFKLEECRVLRLTGNLRLTIGQPSPDIEETKNFAQWLLDIGEGKVGEPNDSTTKLERPNDLHVEKCNDPITKLIQFVYQDILNNEDPNYFQQRSLLAPTNEVVHEMNDCLIESFPGEPVEYLSSYSVSKSDYIDGNIDLNLYFIELLYGLKIVGLPNHSLILKVGGKQTNKATNGAFKEIFSYLKEIYL
ncbi:uncharacterized protein LOC143573759 [Bidens hawaiensis]|uniref:uncharacterized protein LOC143573759 n=1 Tax=Bidens hawaiensis TaxID=980011 RepID=UPI004049E4F2